MTEFIDKTKKQSNKGNTTRLIRMLSYGFSTFTNTEGEGSFICDINHYDKIELVLRKHISEKVDSYKFDTFICWKGINAAVMFGIAGDEFN